MIIVIGGGIGATRFVKVKKKTKRNDHIVAILLSAFCIASYFSVNQLIPQAYAGDLVVNGDQEREVDHNQVRYLGIPLPLKVNEYERQATPLKITNAPEDMTVMMETNDFTKLAQYAEGHEAYIRSDRSINMVLYYQEVIQPIADDIGRENGSVNAEQLIEELTLQFPEQDFYVQ